jgi:glyoxylase-like metal-dependent hydrolase (beta-lactamase superfamily II)
MEQVTDGITLLVEDTSTFFFESNVWHVRGRHRDLVIDTGNGIGDLRAELAPLVDGRPVVAVATHHHFDHIGGDVRLRGALVPCGRRRGSACTR